MLHGLFCNCRNVLDDLPVSDWRNIRGQSGTWILQDYSSLSSKLGHKNAVLEDDVVPRSTGNLFSVPGLVYSCEEENCPVNLLGNLYKPIKGNRARRKVLPPSTRLVSVVR